MDVKRFNLNIVHRYDFKRSNETFCNTTLVSQCLFNNDRLTFLQILIILVRLDVLVNS